MGSENKHFLLLIVACYAWIELDAFISEKHNLYSLSTLQVPLLII